MKKIVVLLVEDTEVAANRFRQFFIKEEGFLIEVVRNTGAALRRLTTPCYDQLPVDCIVTNLVLEGSVKEGQALVSNVLKIQPEMPIIVWTKSPPEDISPALDNGARMAMEKYSGEEEVFPDMIRRLIPNQVL